MISRETRTASVAKGMLIKKAHTIFKIAEQEKLGERRSHGGRNLGYNPSLTPLHGIDRCSCKLILGQFHFPLILVSCLSGVSGLLRFGLLVVVLFLNRSITRGLTHLTCALGE